jgi:hypothetical protein
MASDYWHEQGSGPFGATRIMLGSCAIAVSVRVVPEVMPCYTMPTWNEDAAPVGYPLRLDCASRFWLLYSCYFTHHEFSNFELCLS